MEEDDERVCGEAFDHDLELHHQDEDGCIWWCRRCGAEIIEDADRSDA